MVEWNLFGKTKCVLWDKIGLVEQNLFSRRNKSCLLRLHFNNRVWKFLYRPILHYPPYSLFCLIISWFNCEKLIHMISIIKNLWIVEEKWHRFVIRLCFKGCVHYIFASLFCMSKREQLWNKWKWFLFYF